MTRRALLRAALTVVAASLGSAPEARAGNAETFPLGNDAALLAGAVTAATYGASATWYNPARIAVGREDDLDLSASAYLLRLGGVPDLRAAPGSQATRTKLVSLDFNAAPTAIAYRRKWFGVDVGFGLFSPSRTVAYPRTLIRSTPSDGSEP